MRSLYFHVGHRDVVGGGQLALYHLAVALQHHFDVYVSTDWNEAMWGYEFMVEPHREWKVGKPDTIDVFVASEYVRNHHPIGAHNVQYTFFPRYRWDVSGYDSVVTISDYSRRYVETQWGRDDAQVLCGGVFADHYRCSDSAFELHKQPMILNTSRFFMEGDPAALIGHSKNQHVLINAFRAALAEGNPYGWELHLVGSVLTEEDGRYLARCRELAEGVPVFFYPMLGREETLQLYKQSAVFAHAMGYGRADPAETEHYGFCVEKAVLCGAQSIVYDTGGAKEFGGATFTTMEELAVQMHRHVAAPAPIVTETAPGRTFADFVEEVGALFGRIT